MNRLESNKFQILILIILLVLSIIFFWREEINFTKRINHQKVTNYFITIFTSVGTIATIIYSVKQYNLSQLINRTSIKPELYPQKALFKMSDDFEDPGYDIDSGITLAYAAGMASHNPIIIKNIGIGIAKNVKYKWIYNINEIKSIIENTYDLTPDSDPVIIPSLLPGSEISITSPDLYLSCCGPKLYQQYEKKFACNFDYINFPILPEHLKSEFNQWKEEIFPKKLPALKLMLSYHDVQDFEYILYFNVQVVLIHKMVNIDFKFLE